MVLIASDLFRVFGPRTSFVQIVRRFARTRWRFLVK